MWRTTLTATGMLILCACSTPRAVTGAPPDSLMAPCPPLPALTAPVTPRAQQEDAIDVSTQYEICRKRHGDLVQWLSR